MVAPAPGEMARPVSRMDTFEHFLGNFVQALGQGMAAAHGPGAAGKGFGAAVGAPYQQAMQQFQVGQQAQANQAEIQQRQAQTQVTQAEAAAMPAELQAKLSALTAQPRFDPTTRQYLGTMNDAQYQNYIKGQGGAAQGAAAKVAVANINNPALPFDPQIAAAIGHPELANHVVGKVQFDEYMKEFNAKTKLVGTSRTGEQIREDVNGNFIKIPVTSTSRPNLPTGTAPSGGGTPSGFPRNGGGAGGPKVVGQGKVPGMAFGTDPQGKQVAGSPSELRAAGVANPAPLPATEVAKVNTARQLTAPNGLFAMIDNDLKQFKPDELEGLGPRWNEFLAGSVGTADPRYVALRTHVNGLLNTAIMQAHVGARGGEALMEHFQDIASAGKMSKETLAAAINAEKPYVEEKAMRPQPQGGSSTRVTSYLKKLGL